MKVRIAKGTARGTVAAPPSKSFAHRYLIAAALCRGESKVTGIALSEDVLATLDCIAALGASYRMESDCITVQGIAEQAPDNPVFRCRESGSTLRFFIPIALTQTDNPVFTGTPRLIDRGIGIYEKLFDGCGIRTEKSETEIRFSGRLTAGNYTVTGGVSSQFVTGLLFALSLCDGNSTLTVLPPVESRPYIDITLHAMRRFGAQIEEISPNVFSVCGVRTYLPKTVAVEGDWSNAAALLAYNNFGGDVTVTGTVPDSLQGDSFCVEALRQIKAGNAKLCLSDCPDLAPVLFAAAAVCGGAEFTGTARLKIKESDRAAVMAEVLSKFGIECIVGENAVTVKGGNLTAPAEPLSSYNDHRIVMAEALLLSRTGGSIFGAEAVNKSYPAFFETLKSLGLEVHCEA